jgi:hypothetical protein
MSGWDSNDNYWRYNYNTATRTNFVTGGMRLRGQR